MASRQDLMSRTDRTLVRLSLAGEDEAGNELARRYQRQVEKLIHMITGNLQLSADLAQEAFLKAFRGLGTFKPDANFEPWLMQIARNVAMDHLRLKEHEEVSIDYDAPSDPRSQRSRRAVQLVDPEMTPSTQAEINEIISYILTEVYKLPKQYEECFVMHVLEDLSFDEIAEQTGRPASTVRQYVTRAARKVKAGLKAAGVYDSLPRRPLRKG